MNLKVGDIRKAIEELQDDAPVHLYFTGGLPGHVILIESTSVESDQQRLLIRLSVDVMEDYDNDDDDSEEDDNDE